MLRMGPKLEWEPPIVKTSSAEGSGIDELWEVVGAHRKHQEQTGALEEKRTRRVLEEVESMVALRLRERATAVLTEGRDDGLARDLAARSLDPYRAAEILLSRVGSQAAGARGEGTG